MPASYAISRQAAPGESARVYASYYAHESFNQAHFISSAATARAVTVTRHVMQAVLPRRPRPCAVRDV